MNAKTLGATAGVAALIALATAVPATAGSSAAVSLDKMIPALAAPQTDADHVPADVDLSGLGGVDEATVRSLGSDEAAHYWIGRAGTSEVCLIMQLMADSEVAASTCTELAHFYRAGMSLLAGKGAQEPESTAEAYLIPADVVVPTESAASRAAGAQGASASPQFISGRPDQLRDLEQFEVRRDDGSIFRFTPLSAADA